MESANHTHEPSGGLLFGAEAIAHRLFGDVSLKRRVYRLADAGDLPVFRLGSVICTTEALIAEHLADRERAARENAARRRGIP